MFHYIPVLIRHAAEFQRTADGVVAILVVLAAEDAARHYFATKDLMAEIMASFVLSSASKYISMIFSPSLSHDLICFKFIMAEIAICSPSWMPISLCALRRLYNENDSGLLLELVSLILSHH
jgi:hypothetical protein